MNPIPKIDLREHYQAEFNSRNDEFMLNLGKLVKKIETEDNPVVFKEYLFSAGILWV